MSDKPNEVIEVTPDMLLGSFDVTVAVDESVPVLKPNEYQCERCRNIYEFGWSDEEAETEYQNNFPTEAKHHVSRAIVCDDCYRQIMQPHPGAEGE